jgi:hypothetical protein
MSVAKQRIVNTKFWDDSYIAGLTPMEKLVFLYLITNPLTNISGVYELPLKRAAFDVGISVDEMDGILGKLEVDGKIARASGWIGVTNFVKHQTLNPKIKIGIVQELRKAPREVVDRVSIDYPSLSIPSEGLSHSNSNPNSNGDSNAFPFHRLSTAQTQELHRGTEALTRRMRIAR